MLGEDADPSGPRTDGRGRGAVPSARVEPRPGVVVVGAGGHALVCIEVLREAGIDVAGCVSSDGTSSADLGALGVPMLGTDRDLATLVAGGYTDWFVAIGDNAARAR